MFSKNYSKYHFTNLLRNAIEKEADTLLERKGYAIPIPKHLLKKALVKNLIRSIEIMQTVGHLPCETLNYILAKGTTESECPYHSEEEVAHAKKTVQIYQNGGNKPEGYAAPLPGSYIIKSAEQEMQERVGKIMEVDINSLDAQGRMDLLNEIANLIGDMQRV